MSPNKILYNFNVRDTLELLTLAELLSKDFSRLRQLKREVTENSIVFANIIAKAYYDDSHKNLSVSRESSIYLRLHYEYKISKVKNYKLHNQRVDLFKILDKVKRLIYRLDLSSLIKIHPVISVAQLEPARSTPDPYKRAQQPPQPVKEDGLTNLYEIEILLDKRVSRGKTQYLIK